MSSSNLKVPNTTRWLLLSFIFLGFVLCVHLYAMIQVLDIESWWPFISSNTLSILLILSYFLTALSMMFILAEYFNINRRIQRLTDFVQIRDSHNGDESIQEDPLEFYPIQELLYENEETSFDDSSENGADVIEEKQDKADESMKDDEKKEHGDPEEDLGLEDNMEQVEELMVSEVDEGDKEEQEKSTVEKQVEENVSDEEELEVDLSKYKKFGIKIEDEEEETESHSIKEEDLGLEEDPMELDSANEQSFGSKKDNEDVSLEPEPSIDDLLEDSEVINTISEVEEIVEDLKKRAEKHRAFQTEDPESNP